MTVPARLLRGLVGVVRGLLGAVVVAGADSQPERRSRRYAALAAADLRLGAAARLPRRRR